MGIEGRVAGDAADGKPQPLAPPTMRCETHQRRWNSRTVCRVLTGRCLTHERLSSNVSEGRGGPSTTPTATCAGNDDGDDPVLSASRGSGSPTTTPKTLAG